MDHHIFIFFYEHKKILLSKLLLKEIEVNFYENNITIKNYHSMLAV